MINNGTLVEPGFILSYEMLEKGFDHDEILVITHLHKSNFIHGYD